MLEVSAILLQTVEGDETQCGGVCVEGLSEGPALSLAYKR